MTYLSVISVCNEYAKEQNQNFNKAMKNDQSLTNPIDTIKQISRISEMTQQIYQNYF